MRRKSQLWKQHATGPMWACTKSYAYIIAFSLMFYQISEYVKNWVSCFCAFSWSLFFFCLFPFFNFNIIFCFTLLYFISLCYLLESWSFFILIITFIYSLYILLAHYPSSWSSLPTILSLFPLPCSSERRPLLHIIPSLKHVKSLQGWAHPSTLRPDKNISHR